MLRVKPTGFANQFDILWGQGKERGERERERQRERDRGREATTPAIGFGVNQLIYRLPSEVGLITPVDS